MPCVGFVLRPQKRPRVLTATLAAAAEARGLSLLALDPSSTPEQWRSAGVDVIVHKVPDETGIDARLEAWAAAAGPAGGVLLDPPACVKRLQDREAMLQPLAASGPLLLTRQEHSAAAGTHQYQASVQQPSSVLVSIPHQVVLQPGCSVQQALQQMAAAGLTMPVLVKPLSSAATDSHRPHADTPTETAAAAAAAAAAGEAAAGAGPGHDGHTLGLIWTEEGLKTVLHNGQNQQADRAIVAAQQQQTQQQQQQTHPPQQQQAGQVDLRTLPNVCLPQQSSASLQIPLPAVLQQYVPHQALYKLYVIGPSCVLTRRNTLTLDILEAATAAAPAGRRGVVILPRLSADKWAAVQAAQQQQQQVLNSVSPTVNSASSSSSSSSVDGGGAAIADASVADDPAAPPLWAMQQLAAHLRATLGLNLFNVDIIAPSQGLQATDEGACCAASLSLNGSNEGSVGDDEGQGPPQGAAQSHQRQLLVVDINYFPGYDKVPGAELLFAQFLAQCTR